MAFVSDGNEQTLSADGETTEVNVIGTARISATGSFGGGTLKVQEKRQDNTWKDIAGASFTDAFHKVLAFPSGSQTILRFSLSGASNPDIDTVIQGSDS